MNRPLREYPSEHARDWKSGERIQAEIDLMRRLYAKRTEKKWDYSGDIAAGLFISIFCLVVGALIYFLH